MNRSYFDWDKAEKRHQPGTVEYRIYNALKKMIALRKETAAFADFDNRQLLAVDNPNLLVFSRIDPQNSSDRVLVVANFNVEPQMLQTGELKPHGFFHDGMKDLCSGTLVTVENNTAAIPPLTCYWLAEWRAREGR
jgi:amylosucrase